MTARQWMDDGTALVLERLAVLTDAQLDEPTALPGWTRKHVVAHLHFNALGLQRLVAWAATGVETPMYPSAQARAEQIEDGTHLPAAQLRSAIATSAADLAAALDALDPAASAAIVVTNSGRRLPAAEIPWMRAREVWIHGVDLGVATFDDMPTEFLVALVTETAGRRAESGEGPGLAAWLIGRQQSAPTLGPWL